jgi:hypothetical protein
VAVAYVSFINAYSGSGVSSFTVTMPSSSTSTYCAILWGISATSNFSSISQTNVTWTFQAWVQNVNGTGKSVEIWIGIPTGTPGTSATIYNNVTCYMGITCYLFSGLSSRTDIIEDFWVGARGSNQVTFPSFGTGGASAAVMACLISSPSGTAITTSQSYSNWGSAPYGVGCSQYTYASAAGYNGGVVWSENSSYAQTLVIVTFKGFTGIGIKLSGTSPQIATNNIIAGAASPPWTWSNPVNTMSWNQFTQAVLFYQYVSTSATDQGTLSCNAMNFYYLGQATPLLIATGYYLHLELWVAYCTAGTQPNWTEAANPIVGSAGHAVGHVYDVLQIINVSGLDSPVNVLENAAIYTASSSTATSPFQVNSVVVNTTGDLGLIAVAQGANSQTYYNYWYADTTPIYSNGPCVMASLGLASSGTNNVYVTPNTAAYFTALAAVLKAPGANQHTGNFAENYTSYFADTISKANARVFATETGIKTVLADTYVLNRMPGGPRTFTENGIQAVYSENVSKMPGKLPKETYSLVETFSKNRIPHGPQTYTETYALTETFSWHGSFHPTFAEVFSLVESFGKNHGFLPSAMAESFSFLDLGIVKNPGKLPVETFSLIETFSKAHAPGGPLFFAEPFSLSESFVYVNLHTLAAVAEVFSLVESFQATHVYVQAFSELISLFETFSIVGQESRSFSDVLAMSDVFTPVYAQALSFAELVSIGENFKAVHGQFLTVSDVISLLDSISTVHGYTGALSDLISLVEDFGIVCQETIPFSDTITMQDSFVPVHNPVMSFSEILTMVESFSPVHRQLVAFLESLALADFFSLVHTTGGVFPVSASGALSGAGGASAFVAAWVYAATRGAGRLTGMAGIAYMIAVMAKGASLLHGLAGFEYSDTGAAAGGSAAEGVEGAHVVSVSGSTEGDGSSETTSALSTASTGEADGVSPEMDCDTQCIFSAEGNTMPETLGSAAAVGTYTLLHLIATLRGASLAVGQVHSPVVASGACEGASTAEYVSIAIYDAETVGGESDAVGVAGGLFHVRGQCDPIMASNAGGTANYRPGQIAGVVGGRGVVAGVPTVVGV